MTRRVPTGASLLALLVACAVAAPVSHPRAEEPATAAPAPKKKKAAKAEPAPAAEAAPAELPAIDVTARGDVKPAIPDNIPATVAGTDKETIATQVNAPTTAAALKYLPSVEVRERFIGAMLIGNNVVNYSITAGPCVAYAQSTISIEGFVSADLSKYPEKNIYCQKSDLPFNLNQYVKNIGGNWFGPGLMGSVFDPEKANIGRNILIYQTHSMPTASLCPDTTALVIRVAQIPTISISTNKTEGCVPLEVSLSTPNNSGGSGLWYLGDGSEPITDLDIVHTYTAPGSYTATYRYTSIDGCVAPTTSVSTAINVFEKPKPNFTFPDEILISDAAVQMSNLTTILSHNKYLWTVLGLADTFKTVHPVITFPKIGRYEIQLTAETIKGCKNTISKYLEVRNDFNVFVPNTFTPNEDDLNDVFKPVFSSYGLDSKTYELEIFDRWGQSLFRSKDPQTGWDGTIKIGRAHV